MSDVIGRGVIEVAADTTQVSAGIDKAKKSIATLGEASAAASARSSKSIDNYLKKLEQQNATVGMSTREAELYRLTLRGATAAQLAAADAALRHADALKRAQQETSDAAARADREAEESATRGEALREKLKNGFIAVAVATATAVVAAAVSLTMIADQISSYKDLSDKVGDTAENIGSLQTAADLSGVAMDSIASASIKLTAALSKTDDESKSIGAGLAALGLDFDKFKQLKPVEQLDAVAGAMDGFADGSEKSAVAMAIFGKSGAELIPFLNDLAEGGERQIKVSQAQIEAADELMKTQARLRSEFGDLSRQIASAAIPALTQLIGATGDTISQFQGLSRESISLSSNDGIKTFAEGAAIAIAELVDGVYNASNGLLALKGSLNVIAADTRVAFNFATRAFSSFLPDDVYNEQTKDFKDAVSDREKVLKDANSRYEKLSSGLGLADRLRARLGSGKFVDPRILGNPGSIAEQAAAWNPKPRLSISGLTGPGKDKAGKGGKDTAAQDAKAELAFDLEMIRQSSQVVIGEYANSEKIMQAMRSANRIQEKEYFASKLAFLNLNGAAQAAALQEEIERLQQEKLIGKDKLDNDKKISEAQAKLAKVRADTRTDIIINTIAEAAATTKLARAYDDAARSADDYVNTIAAQARRELSGVGMGEQVRARNERRNQRDDKFQGRRDTLDSQRRAGQITAEDYDKFLAVERDAHQRALAEDEIYWQQKLDKQLNWSLGANEAWQSYQDAAANAFENTQQVVSNALKGMEDAMVSFVTTGKLDFNSLADSIVADITRIVVKQQIANAVMSMMGDGSGGSGGGGGGFLGDVFGALMGGRAIGGPVSAGNMYRVNERGPELLNVAGEQYLMMGSQGGSVTPNSGTGGGGNTINITVNQTFVQGTSRATTLQAAADARRQLEVAGRNL